VCAAHRAGSHALLHGLGEKASRGAALLSCTNWGLTPICAARASGAPAGPPSGESPG
jgi:hypothetical protein